MTEVQYVMLMQGLANELNIPVDQLDYFEDFEDTGYSIKSNDPSKWNRLIKHKATNRMILVGNLPNVEAQSELARFIASTGTCSVSTTTIKHSAAN